VLGGDRGIPAGADRSEPAAGASLENFQGQIIPALTEGVAIERELLAATPEHGSQRLIRALTDQALGQLVVGSNALASEALRDAHTIFPPLDT
jgi:hypothetical protein